MIYIVKVLIGRAVYALDRPFTYYSEDNSIHEGMRVLVSFSQSKETIAFVIEEPIAIDKTIEEYQKEVKALGGYDITDMGKIIYFDE